MKKRYKEDRGRKSNIYLTGILGEERKKKNGNIQKSNG